MPATYMTYMYFVMYLVIHECYISKMHNMNVTAEYILIITWETYVLHVCYI